VRQLESPAFDQGRASHMPDVDVDVEGKPWDVPMIAAYLLLGGLVSTFACMFIFLTTFIVRGARYRALSEPDYARLTLGNPLIALFIERLLTHEGLRFRSIFCWSLVTIWAFVLSASVVTSLVG
jgi:hypothetical protein